MNGLDDRLDRILIGEKRIHRRVEALAEAISAEHEGEKPVLLGVLKGAFIFLSDLARKLEIDCSIEFVRVSSYGNAAQSQGRVNFDDGFEPNVADRRVIIVEDIVDTGLTLQALRRRLSRAGCDEIEVCCLLDKEERRRVDVTVDYRGFEVPNEFLVGYGLDYAEQFRHLPYIAVLKPSVYE